jgi:hypothetical protein
MIHSFYSSPSAICTVRYEDDNIGFAFISLLVLPFYFACFKFQKKYLQARLTLGNGDVYWPLIVVIVVN